MKIFIVSFLLICATALQVHAQSIANVNRLNIYSKILDQERPILIYTPQSYEDEKYAAYDVIYVFDAQNREEFDLVHSSLSYLNFSKKIIVVGVCSPYYEETNYVRNDDYLPKPINNPSYYPTNNPNAENFWKYFTEEVVPYIDNNYRTTDAKFAVGHSLSASFVVDKTIHFPGFFKGTIAVSPNFAYDEFRLANDFTTLDFTKIKENTFLYTSQADEFKTMPKTWNEGYEKFKNFIEQKKELGKLTLLNKEFPEENHWGSYLPSLVYGLKNLKNFMDNNPNAPKGEFQTITFQVSVPDKNDEVYIVGNQENLGNWNPAKVKFKKITDYDRELKIKVQFPIEFKITRGSWQSEGATNENDGGNIVISKPDSSKIITLKVLQWFDK